ncbi:hypothetical protein [Helicobacter sp. 23-1045]
MGAPFALLKFFGRSQTASLVSHPKNFKNTKLPPQILELFLNADSAIFVRDSAISLPFAESYKKNHKIRRI